MSRADMIVREEDERGIPSRFVIKPAGDLYSHFFHPDNKTFINLVIL